MLKNDINIPLLVTIGTVSSLLLVVVLIGTHAWYLFEVKAVTEATWSGTITNQAVYDLKQEQRATLSASPKWVEKGTVAKIPIGQAMETVAANGGKLPTK